MKWTIWFMALALTGCVQAEPPTANLNEAEAAYINQKGTGVLKGQAFARQIGGGIVTAAGEKVYLVPATSYYLEVTERTRRGDKMIVDPRADRFSKETTADGDGRFTFNELYPGNYIVLTQVRWLAGSSPEGGPVTVKATVANGKISEVVAAR